MMDLQLDQLRAFVAVLDGGTFEAAARALQVTPSAISQRIKGLEAATGRVLVQRVKPARATASGETVLRMARQVMLLEDDAERALGADEVESASIPLVINSDSLATWALPALARVASAHRVVFDVFREDQDHSTARLRDGSVMAAITSVSEPVQGCVVRPLGHMRYRPMASPEFAERWFTDGATATAAALRVAPVIIYDRSDDLQDRYLRRHAGRSAAPPRHFVPASGEFATAVELGMGWGMLPEAQIGGLEASGRLVAIGDDDVDVPLYWQQWRLHSALLKAVADEIVATASAALR
jgi:LysR family transcriptional regulator (chromosome initiation inhibitor)